MTTDREQIDDLPFDDIDRTPFADLAPAPDDAAPYRDEPEPAYELTAAEKAKIDSFAARYHWPPSPLAPGIEIKLMPVGGNTDYGKRGINGIRVPAIVNEAAFYRNVPASRLSSFRGEDGDCWTCRGAGFVARHKRGPHGELGVATGEVRPCPQRCRLTKHERIQSTQREGA